MDTASRIPGPEPQEAATTRPKRATSDTPPLHSEAAFGDAIVGAIKQMHTVLPEACYACGLCEVECPTAAIRIAPVRQLPNESITSG